MWRFETTALATGVARYLLIEDERVLSYEDVVERWLSAEFAAWFSELLAASPFPAFFWECRPVTAADADEPFEFVLLQSKSLEGVTPDRLAFDEHFRASGSSGVKVFPNLGRDATLVVPTPEADADAYPHLATFVRRAPDSQRVGLWESVSRAMNARIGGAPIWLSTCGLGVYWLHVRLDSRPKYYQFQPYRIFRGPGR